MSGSKQVSLLHSFIDVRVQCHKNYHVYYIMYIKLLIIRNMIIITFGSIQTFAN